MANNKAKDDHFYIRGVFPEIIAGKPVEVEGQLLPEVFRVTFYIIDNQGRNLRNQDFKEIPLWTISLTLKTNKSGFIEVLQCNAKGARDYRNPEGKLSHSFDFATNAPKEYPLDEYLPLTARHFAQMERHRAKLIGEATAGVLWSYQFIGEAGKVVWKRGNNLSELPDELILNIRKNTEKRAYTRVSDTYLQEIARRYLEILATGDTAPVKTLHEQYYKSLINYDRLSGLVSRCRKENFLPKYELTNLEIKLNQARKKQAKKGKK